MLRFPRQSQALLSPGPPPWLGGLGTSPAPAPCNDTGTPACHSACFLQAAAPVGLLKCEHFRVILLLETLSGSHWFRIKPDTWLGLMRHGKGLPSLLDFLAVASWPAFQLHQDSRSLSQIAQSCSCGLQSSSLFSTQKTPTGRYMPLPGGLPNSQRLRSYCVLPWQSPGTHRASQ